MLKTIAKPSAILLSLLLVTGCGGETPFESYSNYDLKTAYAGCKSDNMSPGKAVKCGNIEKECAKRKSKSGFRC